ncbi:MAG: putative type pilin PilA [Pseudonocardiales bacterium]|nr:putative type pilin PilA [Pseudonocardiales bacterium]
MTRFKDARWPAGAVHAEAGPRERGFTLIELLVVVVILGVLIAIAIPLYLNYRKGANDASARSDLRNAVNVLEQCAAETARYPATITVGANGACAGQTINVSSGTTIAYFSIADLSAFIISATNSNGAGKTWCYHSKAAGSIGTTTTPVTAWRLAC